MKNSIGKLTLVGAGPGDPELISVKGLKAIQKADVILYDALVSKELIQSVQPSCKLVYVGKRKGKKEFPQDEINRLLVFYAIRFKNVVRLKGGDPNVFGRGHEEMSFASSYNIEVEIIPGISSSIAAPTAAGIPLTKRGVNESFWVITGTLSNGDLSNDIELAARSSATIVILMGMTHIEKIARLFQEHRSPLEPFCVIQEATLPSQKIVTGSAANIHQMVVEDGISSPAVIVIGKVVEERNKLFNIIEQAQTSPLLTFNQ